MVLSDDHEDLYGLDRPSSESVNTQVPHDREDLYGLDRPSSESVNTQTRDDREDLYGLDHPNSESMDDVNTSLRLKNRSVSSDSDENGRSKRTRTSSESNSEDADLIGLTLSKTPSFLNLIESELSQVKRRVGRPSNSSRNKSTTEDLAVASEKLKAANFPAIKLTIGAWKRVTKHEGDLIAKCYYAKKKLVWELLDGPLKSKIEIQWSDIIAIRAITPQGDLPGILELELNQPPTFHRETNPQPRKHTLWQQTPDFTGGQAPIHRRHCVTFPPGILNKPYEKLLRCDPRLNELSKQPFPSQLYPYFDQPQQEHNEVSDFSFDNDSRSQLYLKMQYPHHLPAAAPSPSTALFPDLRMHNNSAMPAAPLQHFSSSFPVSGGENTSNYSHINQMSTGLWGGQGPNDLMNVAMGDQTIGMLPASSPPPPPQANWAVPTEDDQAMYLQNDSMINNQDKLMLNYIKNHLLDDNQVTSYDEPTYSFPEQHENTSLDATVDLHGLNSRHRENTSLDAAVDLHGLNSRHHENTSLDATVDLHGLNSRHHENTSLDATVDIPGLNSRHHENTSLDATVDIPGLNSRHHENTSLDATVDLHGLNSSYQMMNNLVEDVFPNYETTYAQQMTWMFPQETNDEFPINYPTQNVNQQVESAQETRN